MNSQDPKEHFGIYIFFLSDCGPSAAVANTLYCCENENLCVCPAQLRGKTKGTHDKNCQNESIFHFAPVWAVVIRSGIFLYH